MRALNKKQRRLLDEWFEENKDDVGLSFEPQEAFTWDFYCKLLRLGNFETVHQAMQNYILEKLSDLMSEEAK